MLGNRNDSGLPWLHRAYLRVLTNVTGRLRRGDATDTTTTSTAKRGRKREREEEGNTPTFTDEDRESGLLIDLEMQWRKQLKMEIQSRRSDLHSSRGAFLEPSRLRSLPEIVDAVHSAAVEHRRQKKQQQPKGGTAHILKDAEIFAPIAPRLPWLDHMTPSAAYFVSRCTTDDQTRRAALDVLNGTTGAKRQEKTPASEAAAKLSQQIKLETYASLRRQPVAHGADKRDDAVSVRSDSEDSVVQQGEETLVIGDDDSDADDAELLRHVDGSDPVGGNESAAIQDSKHRFNRLSCYVDYHARRALDSSGKHAFPKQFFGGIVHLDGEGELPVRVVEFDDTH